MRTVNVSSAKRSLQRRKITASRSDTVSAFGRRISARESHRAGLTSVTADWWGETQLPARSAAATAAICPAERFTALLVLMRSAVIAAFAAASVAVIAGRGVSAVVSVSVSVSAAAVAVVAAAVSALAAASVVFTGFAAVVLAAVVFASVIVAAAVVRTLAVAAVLTLPSVASVARTVVAARLPVGTAGLSFTRLAGLSAGLLRRLSVLPCGASLLAAALVVAAAALAAFGLVEAGDAVLLRTVGRLLDLRADVVGVLQPFDLLALAVQCHDLPHARNGQRGDVGHRVLRRREGHRSGQHVALDAEPFAFGGLERFAQARELLAGVDIGVVFVHHAALELRALPGQLLGVERNVLHARGSGRDARKARHPRRAAQFAAAGAQSADASGLLAGADLLHLDADVEPFGEDLDQFAEVHALVGDVVEDGFDLVALILHVADFHVQAHVGGDLPRGDHRLVLQRDGLLPLFDVVGFGLAVDLLVFAVVGVESRAAHLARHQVARERHDADVVTRRRFDGYDVAPFEVEVVDVLVERTAGVLETHLDDVARHVDRVLVEPGCFVELEAPVAEFGFRLRAAVAKGAPAAHFGFAGARMSFFGIHDWV